MKNQQFLFLPLVICAAFFLFAGCSQNSTTNEKNQANRAIIEVDFDASMGKGTNEYEFIFTNQDDITRYKVFKALYEKNLPSKVAFSPAPKIPKIIHQIWLGPKSPPPYFAAFREKWKALHPDWEYHLWTDASLDDLELDLRDLIDASPNYAEKSDILRSELLEKFGGVYFDCDMECNHLLDELHHKYDFYIGIEYPHQIATTNNRVWAGISIMAARPNHPIFKRWKEHIRNRWNLVNENYSSPVEKVINHTYFPFTFALLEKYQEDNLTNVVFPATYFYPLTAACASKRRSPVRGFREKIYDFLENIHLKKPRAFSKVYPETLATHYWGSTWQNTTNDQMKTMQQQLDCLRKDFCALQYKLSQMEQKETPPVSRELQAAKN